MSELHVATDALAPSPSPFPKEHHMSHDHKQLNIRHESPAIWRVTFNNPPINLVDHGTLQELHQLPTAIEASTAPKVSALAS